MTPVPEAAFLTFSLGPVQTFIAGARTVRDLWTGSYLLSWLTFKAMLPVHATQGLDAFVFPALRGNPLLELHEGRRPPLERLLSPCLPNRFTVVVPADQAGKLKLDCEQAARDAWNQIAESVHRALQQEIARHQVRHAQGWGALWQEQVDSFFEIRTTTLPWNECDPATLDRLLPTRSARAVPEEDALYERRMELLGGLAEARRSVRHLPAYRVSGDVPQKCSLLGTYEQMGPALLEQSRAFWEDVAERVSLRGTHTRTNERLCAISLIKRFAWPAYFAGTLKLNPQELRFDDTATEAAREWLSRPSPPEPIQPASIRRRFGDWSGQWLHWTRQQQDPRENKVPDEAWQQIRQRKQRHPEPVPLYYAVLMIDGDNMGKWLRGDMGVSLNRQRHQQLSGALTDFALGIAPRLVETEHPGTLIYAGGDDVLALLPTRPALACARDLEQAFRANWGADSRGNKRLPNDRVSVSAGLAVVHYKDDLRFALNAARGAEKAAKAAGKDALTITICKRSGEHTSVTLPWSLVGALDVLVQQFAQGISDRWAYHLRAELPTLRGLPWPAITSEVGRLLDRIEDRNPRLRQEHHAAVQEFLTGYHQTMTREREQTIDEPAALQGFVTLCQAASFLSRGRDER